MSAYEPGYLRKKSHAWKMCILPAGQYLHGATSLLAKAVSKSPESQVIAASKLEETSMGTGWESIQLEALYATPSRNGLTRPKNVRGKGYPMINMGELFAHDRIGDIEMDLVPMTESEIEKFSVKRGDLLFARQSLVAAGAGKCSLVKEVPQPTTFESHLIRIRLDQTKTCPDFYYYYFRSPSGKANVQSLVMQVAAAGIRGSELAKLRVPLPDLPTQRRIAGILSAYDDLIENNLRRIRILEEMAQSLYREWFVHFRFPGHESVPLIDSPLGPIPEGWEVKPLGELYTTSSGGTPSRKKPEYFEDGIIDWVKTGELQDGFVFSSEERITPEALKNSSAKVFPPNTVLIALYGATIGQLGILSAEAATNQACCAFLNSGNPFGRAFSFFILRHYRDDIIGLRLGAAQQNISQAILRSFQVVAPPAPCLEAFNQCAEPLFDASLNLQRRNQTLRQTRDLLLPKLLSSENSFL